MRRLAVFTLLAALVSGLAVAQPPVNKQAPSPKGKQAQPAAKKDAPPAGAPLPDVSKVTAEEKSFNSVDGVKLRGLFYKSTNAGNGPVVILLHEYKKDPNAKLWDDTAKYLAASGFNAFRFAFRGHGDLKSLHSKDIAPEEFFAGPYSAVNRALVRAANPAAKNSLDALKDFGISNAYLPMLVQDLAAARTLLDQMNDAGECNTSSVYLLGAGDIVNLGFLFLAAEWHRERERPKNIIGIVPPVTAARPLFGGTDPAGIDYAGAVWLGPTTTESAFPIATVKLWVNNVSGLKIRNETPMLFLYGGADQRGRQGANTYFGNVLRANVKTSGGGTSLPKLVQTFKHEVGKGVKNAGSGLLGNNLGTERTVIDFLEAVERERKNKPRKTRDLEKPLYIDVTSFGLIR